MDKDKILELLAESIAFTDEEKENINKNFDKLPDEFLIELEKMLVNEKERIDLVETEFEEGMAADMRAMKDEFVAVVGDEKKAEAVMEEMKQTSIDLIQGKANQEK